jgi:hypothetical protein
MFFASFCDQKGVLVIRVLGLQIVFKLRKGGLYFSIRDFANYEGLFLGKISFLSMVILYLFSRCSRLRMRTVDIRSYCDEVMS